MTNGRPCNRLRPLIALWTLLWMVVAAPCAMAGDLGGSGKPALSPEATSQMAGHPAPAGEHSSAAELLCFQDCNQLAVSTGPQADAAPLPAAGLAEESGNAPALLLATARTGYITGGKSPYPKAATYLLNRTFLI